MNKTFRISFQLRITYSINCILHSLKQIPLVKRALPDKLYGIRGFKLFAAVIALIWEFIKAFLGKFLYFFIMFYMMMLLYTKVDSSKLFLHLLVLLTTIGAFANTYMFSAGNDKYYAIILMRMNAKEYTLINYFYKLFLVLISFAVFGIIFGLDVGLPVWQCIMIPLFVVGIKLWVETLTIHKYERTGIVKRDTVLGKWLWPMVFVLLGGAYGLPAIGIVLPDMVCVVYMVLGIVLGLFSIPVIFKFKNYHDICKKVLFDVITIKEEISELNRTQVNAKISLDSGIESKRKGFEYLNELFIRRHQKILWKPAKLITKVYIGIGVFALMALYFKPELKEGVNALLTSYLPYFIFIMYATNRGMDFTRALFVNCDHSLLTYSFYKQPKAILSLYQIRLREIIKINLLPAGTLGVILIALLLASGGAAAPLDYVVIVVYVVALSIFFSMHNLTIYYLLQPYTAGTELKSGTYQLVTSVTYFICYFFMGFKMGTFLFGIAAIVFCVVYCVVASILVYWLAPKTFRIRA